MRNDDKTVIWGVLPLSLKPQDKPTRQIVDTYGKYMLLDDFPIYFPRGNKIIVLERTGEEDLPTTSYYNY
jgi:hypothetical protein